MKFQEAEEMLNSIAKGKYCNLEFAKETYSSGSSRTICRIYVGGEKYYTGNTWSEAFTARELALSKAIEEAPEVEA